MNVNTFLGQAIKPWLERLSRSRLPQTEGSLRLRGVRAPVEIYRDRWGVPHLYAQNTEDVMFAQGFVHAQDRLWQMDFYRRLVAGRLSEVLGAETVHVDRWTRIIGFRRVAERESHEATPENGARLEAYAAGVNACIARGRLPVEFSLLRYHPEPWTPADSLSWNKLISWMLSLNWETEILRAQLIARLGPERAAELEAGYLGRWPCVLPPGVDCARIGDSALSQARDAEAYTGPTALDGVGSNNWVLSGARSASGMPLLANDMHLTLNLPAIWYENHLAGGAFQVTGVSFPGVPGVVAGHNGHVAWGFTASMADTQDLYVEHLRRADGRVQYEFRGEWREAEVRHETIRVRDAATLVEEVVVTHHGPVINALAADFTGEQPLALNWTALEPDTMIDAIYATNAAQDCAAFHEALRLWTSPVLNVVYADTAGNIGYTLAGKIPLRAHGSALVPVPGWTGEYEWTGTIPFDELPHVVNPEPGFIATANNRVTGDDYPHFISSEYAMGDRAQRIVELIRAREKVDLDYMRAMQYDQVSPTARAVAAIVGSMRVEGDDELSEVVGMLRAWDGTLSVDSEPAALHEVFMRRLLRLLVDRPLGDLAVRYAGKGPTRILNDASMFIERSWEWLQDVLAQPESHWFDLGHGEKRDDVVRLALRESVDFLKKELGLRRGDWAWGKLHTLTYGHPLGRVPSLAPLFNRGPFPMGGDGTTVWASATSRHDLNHEVMIGPPFRFMADLGDLRHARAQLVPGQSGHPASAHYDDQVDAWCSGEYHTMWWEREDVEREARELLRLAP